MERPIADEIRTYRTEKPLDRCAVLLDAAQDHLQDGDVEQAVVIWKELVFKGGEYADSARLNYAEHLFDEYEDDDAYAQLDAVLEPWRIFSKSWLRAVEMVEQHDPELALYLCTLAIECVTREDAGIPARASRLLHLAATCRRLRWEAGIRLTDTDLLAKIGHLEKRQKELRLRAIINEPKVVERRLHFWARELLESLDRPSGTGIPLERPAAYYLKVERVLRAQDGGRVVAAQLEGADWTRLVELADNAKHTDDLPNIVSGYDQGTVVEWPPGRNQACWCGSGTKYKKCCGANRPPP
ncbi:SEC-C motif-containing protein [Kribbella orskensis]|uniref:SEC-C motif-containing protein n=1 Tax=Kribbella orskensis TaxID=2512216 RepID=A0ABY2B6X4_9ACTN|nr:MULTISPECIES: SEC-C domain-containing protein [Kribbella]TCN28811.1 SEC-C motif-containing protein [Kribbella sp. VKM Ac-2500]TCO08621.1 SEC-C motif-containing protein [Kribbella orskensis]